MTISYSSIAKVHTTYERSDYDILPCYYPIFLTIYPYLKVKVQTGGKVIKDFDIDFQIDS